MSRIGKKPVEVPPDVKVTVEGGVLVAERGKDKLSQKIPDGVTVSITDPEDNKGGKVAKLLVFERAGDARPLRALHGLMRSIAANMIIGLTQGFEKRLRIEGVGYNAKMQGKQLVMQLGFTHPVNYDPPEGITIESPEPTLIVIKGTDKQLVGEVAAEIRDIKPPEPYKGKGIRYEDEVVRRKVGKAFVSAQ